MSGEIIVLVTAPAGEEASSIAEALVNERLAACVNLVPGVESVYRWEGKVNRDRETLLIIKSTGDRYAELEQRVKELHSYSTPEIISISIDRGDGAYLGWLRDSIQR